MYSAAKEIIDEAQHTSNVETDSNTKKTRKYRKEKYLSDSEDESGFQSLKIKALTKPLLKKVIH